MPLDVSTLRARLQEALGDDCTVRDLLGEGGFAAVYRVRDRTLDRDVAVKVLDLGLTPSTELAERFVREARTVARLQHPNIVPIHRVGGYKNSLLYIVMRYVDGPSLRRLLDKRKRLSVDNAVRIARQVVDALGYAHKQGVVHRDVKPDNILLDSAGNVLVTDFGIAKATEGASSSQLTSVGMVVGTPHYMSPEQATGERVDPRSDLYSLGIVLYQMLAGAPPFDGDSAQAILMKQATATAKPIRRIRRAVPLAVAEVLDRLLAKDPAERFQTADELSRALVTARPAAAQNRVAVGRTVPPVRAARAVVVGAAAVLLAAGATAVGILSFGRPPELRVAAPVPDSLNLMLQRRGILGREDTCVFAFSPSAERESGMLVVARHRVAVAAPGRLRGYPRDGLVYRFAVRWHRGPRFLFILEPEPGRRDTVFANLSARDTWELARGVDKLLARDATPFRFALPMVRHRPAERVDTP
jgi:predicted Ser/Thr protein kinase